MPEAPSGVITPVNMSTSSAVCAISSLVGIAKNAANGDKNAYNDLTAQLITSVVALKSHVIMVEIPAFVKSIIEAPPKPMFSKKVCFSGSVMLNRLSSLSCKSMSMSPKSENGFTRLPPV